MAILTLKDLLRESARVSFKNDLILRPNIFEVFDFKNNIAFAHYNDLNFLYEFQNHLINRGFFADEDFYFQFLPHTVRLNLVSSNAMEEYDSFEDLYYKQIALPPVNFMPVFYLHNFLRVEISQLIYNYFLTNTNDYFYELNNKPIEVLEN